MTLSNFEFGRATVMDHLQVGLLRDMFATAVHAVSAESCLAAHLPEPVRGRTYVVAVGKAGAAMAREVARHFPRPIEGIVLTRYGHGLSGDEVIAGVDIRYGGHPLPDASGLTTTCDIFAAVSSLGWDDQLLALVSGGGSALLTMPAHGISLVDKQTITRQLLRCGASISEINCVRKHLSAIKGGRLAVAAAPARVITLAISDIPGDDPAQIASGPTVFDRSTLAEAREIVYRYNIEVPPSIRDALIDPSCETPPATAPGLVCSRATVVARSWDALEAAGRLATSRGYKPIYLGDDLEDDAARLGRSHAAMAHQYAGRGGRWALISGGETTVVVNNGGGRGGRNAEYLLSLCIGLQSAPGIGAIACDTDGIDGTEDNAGAVIDPSTLDRADQLGLSAERSLAGNDAYGFFRALDDLVVTGPTLTNVNDFRAILIDRA